MKNVYFIKKITTPIVLTFALPAFANEAKVISLIHKKLNGLNINEGRMLVVE